jgi:hypothetical protein
LIAVSAGRETGGLDVRLQRARLFRISGQVVDGSGSPKRASLQLMPRDSAIFLGQANAVTRGTDGRFDMPNVAPGSYTLVARSMEGGKEIAPSSAYQAVEVGEHDLESLTVAVAPGVTVNGKVTVDIAGKLKVEETRVVLTPVLLPMSGASGNPHGDGSFSLPNVAPGRYRVNVNPPGDGAYVKSVKLGGMEIGNGEFEIGSGSAPDLAIALSTDAGHVTGRVKGKEGPVSQATVVVVGQNGAAKNATTADDGSFAIGGLAPGEYKFYAWEDVETGAWQDREFLNRYSSKALTLKVDAGGANNLLADVIPSEQ